MAASIHGGYGLVRLGEGAIIFVVVMGSAFSIAIAVESGIKNVPDISLLQAGQGRVRAQGLLILGKCPAGIAKSFDDQRIFRYPIWLNNMKEGEMWK